MAGTYQIIRPYAGDGSRFVVEAMAILSRDDALRVGKNILMYSHNQRSVKYMYRGDLHLTSVRGFAFLRRLYELPDIAKKSNDQRFAMRTIVVQVPFAKEHSQHRSVHCLSGVMLRGVAGEANPKVSIGVPFVAFRDASANGGLEVATFSQFGPELDRLDGDVLVGEIDKKVQPALFEFASDLFKGLRRRNKESRGIQNGLVLMTVSQREIIKAAGVGNGASEAVFEKWRNAVIATGLTASRPTERKQKGHEGAASNGEPSLKKALFGLYVGA